MIIELAELVAGVDPAVPLWNDVNMYLIVLFYKNIKYCAFTLPFKPLEILQQNCINFVNIAKIIILEALIVFYLYFNVIKIVSGCFLHKVTQ